MRQWILTGLTVTLFLLMQTGCGREDTVYLQTDSKTDRTGQTTEVLTEGVEATTEQGAETQAASPGRHSHGCGGSVWNRGVLCLCVRGGE